ncbi:MAG: hypothetical protein ABJE10_10390 [bacterium]
MSTTIAAGILALSACATSKSSTGDTADNSRSGAANNPSSDTAAARKQIAQLEADARALVKTSGCTSAGQCRSAPLGEKACGGPRTYLVYCAATTDSSALLRKLSELSTAEKNYNKNAGMMSTCEFREPPHVAAVGGSCSEARQ